MLSQTIQDALNRQLNAEFASSYLYLSMSAWCESQNLTGMAQWMRMQAQEEWEHGMKIFGFIHDRDGQVVLDAIPAPQSQWDSPLALFQAAYDHECGVTRGINELVDLVLQEKDHATYTFLQWFVSEQVEEESTVKSIVDRLKLVGDEVSALLFLDSQLGQRSSSTPTGP